LGGAALIGQSVWLERPATAQKPARALFSDADVVLLDEIADTILPETKTPGAKAAGVGQFIAMMVTDTYDPREQRVFRDGIKTLERESRRENGGKFMASSPAQRLTLLQRIDREAIEYMRQPGSADRPHYFRMLKELTLLGYFTSEIGYTQAMRYVETPGRFEPCVTYTVGERAWAPHA
jgi:Gluconate 2-dehydrogenase subunit 3